jgi:hypothetical protein
MGIDRRIEKKGGLEILEMMGQGSPDRPDVARVLFIGEL